MKVIQLNNNHFSFLPFGAKTKPEVQKEYDAIKEAIEIIANDSKYPLNIKSISAITGLERATVYARLHTQCMASIEIMKLWQEVFIKRGPGNGMYRKSADNNKTPKTSKTSKNYIIIKDAIGKIAKDPSLKPTMATIAGITGIRQEQIYTYFDSSKPSGNELVKLWEQTLKSRGVFVIEEISHNKKKSIKINSDDVKSIEQAILQIRHEGSKPSILNLEKISGISQYFIRKFFVYSYQIEEFKHIAQLWDDTVALYNGVEDEKRMYNTTLSDDDIKKIETAINMIEADSKYPPTISSLCQITGIDEGLIYRYINDPSTYYLFDRFENIAVSKKTKLVIDSKKSTQSKKKQPNLRDLKRALKMIQNALNSGAKLSYKELETSCGLDKDEVDQLVKQYAQFRQRQSQLIKDMKEQQADWYEKKYNTKK